MTRAVASAEQAFAVQHRALHGAQYLLAAEQRLRDVVEGAGLDRLHGRVLAALGRQQDDGRVARIGRDRAQRLQRRVFGRAVLREVAADEQHVEGLEPLGIAERVVERARRRLHGGALPAFDGVAQQRGADLAVGLQDQDARRVVGGGFHSLGTVPTPQPLDGDRFHSAAIQGSVTAGPVRARRLRRARGRPQGPSAGRASASRGPGNGESACRGRARARRRAGSGRCPAATATRCPPCARSGR